MVGTLQGNDLSDWKKLLRGVKQSPFISHPLLWVTYWVTRFRQGNREVCCKCLIIICLRWSGREDLNLRPPCPELSVR